jgi:hypothetical protein
MRKIGILTAFLTILITTMQAYALTPTLNLPANNSIYNGTIVLNATTDVGAENATFYYSNTSQYLIGSNTSAGMEFTYNFDTRNLVDGTYNFTVSITNSTDGTFNKTNTNITINNLPQWSNNITSVASGSQYLQGKLYQFNITWNDSSLEHVSFESNYTLNASASGVLTNYSSPNVSNSSGTFWINLTDLPAQTFIYRWIANDTSGNSNSTELLVYTISKNSSAIFNLTLNGSEANKSYNLNQNATFIASLNIPNKIIFLNSTCPCWTNMSNTSFASNTTNLTSSGLFSVTAYWNGDENYSASNRTYYFSITDMNFTDNSTSYSSPTTYSSNKNYGFSIKWTGNLSKVIFESNFNGTTLNYTINSINITNWNNKSMSISNDTNGNYWINFTDLSAATYNYRWIANDTNNIWTSASQQTYTISPLSVSPSFTYGGSGPPWTAITSTSVTLLCSATPYPVTLSITGGSCGLVTGGNSISCAFTTGSTSGSASYTCSITSSNHTGSTSGVLSWAPFQSSSPGSTTPTQNTTGSFTITSSSYSVTMEPNTSKAITLTLSNAFSYDIININLSVSGINSSWYTLDKTLVSRLRHDGGTNATQLTLKVPSDAERKIYAIVFTASGKDFSLNKITRQTTITLTVPSEQAQQNETQDNQTQNETNATNATANETNITTGSNVNENNNFLTFLTGLLIKPEYFRNIVLFAGLIAAGLVFLFRSNITEFLTGSLSGKAQTKKEVSKEKKALFSSIKNKFSKYRGTRIVIHVKKEEKEKKEKV